MRQIFIIDDNEDLRWGLGETLKNENYEVHEFSCGEDALEILPDFLPDLIVLDMKIPGKMSGLAVLKKIKLINQNVPVIILTAYATIDTVVESLQHGAYDFMQKPFKNKLLLYKIRNAIEKFDLDLEVKEMQDRLDQQDFMQSVMGNSPKIKETQERIMIVTRTDITVLIQGESGTGKEIVARTIHNYSKRKNNNFVPIDCGAIPDNLLESEFFGYKKGAFTGASLDKKGHFHVADKGTIFLDEIANLSYNMQGKLLRFLEERVIRPIGSVEEIPIDVRIITATNKNLLDAVETGKFRRDLYYRLSEFEIVMPLLRDRIEDIPLLANIFLKQTAKSLNLPIKKFSPEAMAKLTSNNWAGNAREMRNVIRRAALTAGEIVEPDDIQFNVKAILSKAKPTTDDFFLEDTSLKEIVNKNVEDIEKRILAELAQKTDNNKSEMARRLKVSYPTLLSKLKKYDL